MIAPSRLRMRPAGARPQPRVQADPNVGVIYFTEDQEAFTHSLNVQIPGQSVSLGRVTFGPKVSTSIQSADGNLITPHIGI